MKGDDTDIEGCRGGSGEYHVRVRPGDPVRCAVSLSCRVIYSGVLSLASRRSESALAQKDVHHAPEVTEEQQSSEVQSCPTCWGLEHEGGSFTRCSFWYFVALQREPARYTHHCFKLFLGGTYK